MSDLPMPSSFGGGKSRKGNKRGKGSRKGKSRKSRKGRKGIAGGFTMSTAKNALAVVAGAATAATLESKFQGKYEQATGLTLPLGIVGAAATLIAGQTKALTNYRHLLQNAAIGMIVPAGLSFARSSKLIPAASAAGYEAGYIDVGDVDGMDVDGMDSEGLIHIGNVDVGGDDGDRDEKRAARIQAKILKAQAKGQDKRVTRLQARLKKKNLEDEAQELLRDAVDDDDAPSVVVRRGPAAPVLVPRRRPLAPVRVLPRFRGGRGR